MIPACCLRSGCPLPAAGSAEGGWAVAAHQGSLCGRAHTHHQRRRCVSASWQLLAVSLHTSSFCCMHIYCLDLTTPAALLACLPCPAAHPHTKLATLVYCESLCGDVGVVQEMVNGDAGVALVSAWHRCVGGLLTGSTLLCSLSRLRQHCRQALAGCTRSAPCLPVWHANRCICWTCLGGTRSCGCVPLICWACSLGMPPASAPHWSMQASPRLLCSAALHLHAWLGITQLAQVPACLLPAVAC
jgi:hypothetical protein